MENQRLLTKDWQLRINWTKTLGMMASHRQFRRRAVIVLALVGLIITWHLHWQRHDPSIEVTQYPLLSKYVSGKRGNGGAWHIPPGWVEGSGVTVENIIDAASLALNASRSLPERQVPHSVIPLIIHQTWKDTNPDQWPDTFRQSAETWLSGVDSGNMAYFLWDDAGIAQFMRHFEPEIESQFYALPSNVERSDVFRVLVSKWIGGIYGDMDTEPTRPPSKWVAPADLQPWRDPETGKAYNSTEPVKAIVGLEADCLPDSDLYWRMGYFYPIQLTQWSFAWAPGHPILQLFIDRLFATIQAVSEQNGGQLSYLSREALYDIDPLNLTGPVAFTDAARGWLETDCGLRWNSLSGLTDGGLSKLVGDVLVLPITGFSPGRGQYRNMGSKPVTDRSARLIHHAQGSWRKTSLLVEYGKFCRTFFGRCRDWSKVPHNWIF
ncbi:Mannosyltransferase 1 CMT1 [Penicillium sp. CMV-2018d]|nr:Mannosyltransferase 1 CMT1 [Penicillium sp. CMV-2018d]